MTILENIDKKSKAGKKQMAVLLDPDKYGSDDLPRLLSLCQESQVDLLLVGGSHLLTTGLDGFIQAIRERCSLPVVLFPGGQNQVSKRADALLLLSLVSGRNPDLLIGKHVEAAIALKESGLEIIPTAYMLVGNENYTTVQYISNTFPIPCDKDDIALSTALAGQMLGMKLVYMDAGSGALKPIPPRMISRVKEQLEVPLLIGGGIRNPDMAAELALAGADVIVVGNAIEENPGLIPLICQRLHAIL